MTWLLSATSDVKLTGPGHLLSGYKQVKSIPRRYCPSLLFGLNAASHLIICWNGHFYRVRFKSLGVDLVSWCKFIFDKFKGT